MKKIILAIVLIFCFSARGYASSVSSGECLYLVVASEMSSSFHIEALKAQAVAARSYILNRRGAHSPANYNLCDAGSCPHNKSHVKEPIMRAVNETRGVVMTYEGRVINASYFSSSGGVTDDSENVWQEALPYLRSVSDPFEYEPRLWTRTFSLNEITSLSIENGEYIGAVSGVSITRKSANGRVQELTIKGSAGSVILLKEEIRTFFSKSDGGSLSSRNFIIEGARGEAESSLVAVTDGNVIYSSPYSILYYYTVNGSAAVAGNVAAYDGKSVAVYGAQSAAGSSDGNSVTFTGSGWGHGVGLSQRGAEGFAQRGYDYVSILKHYYSGAETEKFL